MKLYFCLLTLLISYNHSAVSLFKTMRRCMFTCNIDLTTNVLQAVAHLIQEYGPNAVPHRALRNAITESQSLQTSDRYLYIAEIIQLLEINGIDITEFIQYHSDFDNLSTLAYAGRYSNLNTFKLLVEKSEASKLYLAEILHVLLAFPEDTALINAEYLIHSQKVEVNQIINNGQPRTALDEAIFQGNNNAQHLLVRYGALTYAQLITRK